MLKVRNLRSGYGEVTILWDVSIDVEKGSITAVLGSNGMGKSTLLKCIAGIQKVKSGKIFFNNSDITDLPPHRRVGMGISLIPEGRRIFPDMTVYENLLIGAYIKEYRKYIKDSLEFIYDLFPILRERRNQLAGTLSGGEQQMLSIARGLMSRPKLLMLDEPSLGLAPRIVFQIMDLIKKLNREYGITILLVEQHVEQALKICDKAYIIERGNITLSGSGEELLRNPKVRESYLGI
ncbi:MAG: ABC transporter ATP-binding protein [Candidatus Verstraetearchaeota archaeon]|jgi:branched-chain amino acid transport system ATP-binding protein|nr:ABC transporter ATP-binding protein [Candidatus Verstraetearchaeota archaeon]